MEKDNFYRRLTVIGIPMVIQQIISVTLNLADTIMVGKVSENALAAVGAANQVYFIFGVVLCVLAVISYLCCKGMKLIGRVA